MDSTNGASRHTKKQTNVNKQQGTHIGKVSKKAIIPREQNLEENKMTNGWNSSSSEDNSAWSEGLSENF